MSDDLQPQRLITEFTGERKCNVGRAIIAMAEWLWYHPAPLMNSSCCLLWTLTCCWFLMSQTIDRLFITCIYNRTPLGSLPRSISSSTTRLLWLPITKPIPLSVTRLFYPYLQCDIFVPGYCCPTHGCRLLPDHQTVLPVPVSKDASVQLYHFTITASGGTFGGIPLYADDGFRACG